MPAGRPLKFKTVEDLKLAIEDYFASTKEDKQCITGLALHLDTSRETLMNYEGRPEYFDTIKKAKDKIHYVYEKRGLDKGRGYDIFTLKNMGWTDRQEHDVQADTTVKIIVDESDANSSPVQATPAPDNSPKE